MCGWDDVDGYETGQRWDYADNGLLYISRASRWREAGYTDWRDGSRQPITYLPAWWDYTGLQGQIICQGGATTGISCGTVSSGNASTPVSDPDGPGPLTATYLTGMIRTDATCIQGGDSGGPVFTSDMRGAVGLNSAGFCIGQMWSEPVRRAVEQYGVWPYAG